MGAGNTQLFDGTSSDTYDLNGNLVEQANSTLDVFYSYDNRQRLTSVVNEVFQSGQWVKTQKIDYTYDLLNDLIGRTLTAYDSSGNPTGTAKARYVFDGANMVLAFNGNGNLTDRYLWGPAVDQVLADERLPRYHPDYVIAGGGTGRQPLAAGSTLWALGDNQNSVRDLVNDGGTLEEHIAYSPFGQQVAAQSSNPGSVTFGFGYTGTYTDSATANQLHGVRWYDPASQRWLTVDPSGLGPDANPYRYCGDGPTDGTDPSGLAEQPGSPADNAALPPAPIRCDLIDSVRVPSGLDLYDRVIYQQQATMNQIASDGAQLAQLSAPLVQRLTDAQQRLNNHANLAESISAAKEIRSLTNVLQTDLQLSQSLSTSYNHALMTVIRTAAQEEINSGPCFTCPQGVPTVTERYIGGVIEGVAGVAVGGIAIAGLALASPLLAAGAGIGLAAYGGYSMGEGIWEVSTGDQVNWTGTSTGRTLNAGDRAELAGQLTPGVILTVAGAGYSAYGRMNGTVNVAPGATAPLTGVQANRAAGDAAADAIAIREAGIREGYFNTVGGVRKPNVIVLGEDVLSIESKVGRTPL